MQKLLWPLVLTGQMALTLYVAHVLVGFTLANQIELLNGGGLKFVAFYIGMCWVGSVAFACAWRSFFKRGPLEAVMRWMTA